MENTGPLNTKRIETVDEELLFSALDFIDRKTVTTDIGAEVLTWPDGGSTPFRGEKATNWEGGYREPMVIRWPGIIQPGTVYNEMFSHYDLIPTSAAARGDPDIVAECLKGHQSARCRVA